MRFEISLALLMKLERPTLLELKSSVLLFPGCAIAGEAGGGGMNSYVGVLPYAFLK